MGWGRGLVLLWGLLGTVPALLCPRCDVTGCRDPAPCPSPHAVCRRTTLTTLRGGRHFRRELTGCDVTGPPEVVLHFRSHGELVTLREERWGEGPGGSPAPSPAPPPAGDERGAALCPTCDSSDGSCLGPSPLLPCPHPGDRCIDVTARGPRGVGEGRLRGCGRAGPCRGLLGFDSGGRGVEMKCCESAQCGLETPPPSGLRCWGCDGPSPTGCAPRALPCGGGRTRCVLARSLGPSGEPWLIRGCATPEWCETPVGLGGLWGGSGGQEGSVGQSESMGQEESGRI
ncbi:urokinase plasminogen activator surface receptor [Catharus ustulatus]|uniref:urokinase plasminogen activator surface receptor n=1 Tax=Catharus ustulatus TaxID=91951 RepID=UPI001407E80A|nr:urokinase plasminogen activator surface receptor [Catharus ustulatus]